MIVRPGDTVVLGIVDNSVSPRDLEKLVAQVQNMLDENGHLNIGVLAISGMAQNFIIRSDET